MKKSALFVLNPFSGDLPDKDEIVQSILDQVTGYTLTLWKTTGENDGEKIKTALKEGDYELILVGGGDGTIKMVAQALEGKECCLLPIPFGSANGLATCLGIESWKDSLRILDQGKSKPMDLLEVNGQVCLHLCDLGINADLIRKFEDGDERGMVSYFKNSLASFFEIKPYRFQVKTNAECEWVDAKMLVIANGSKYGTGATINPGSRMDDGIFEVIALNPEGLSDWLELTYGLIRKDFSHLDFVRTWSCDSLTLSNPDQAPFHIDGELAESPEKINVGIRKEEVCLYYQEEKMD
ncbi:diacylglycerol/lipid kinase family protein [Cyclobacterium roseum]|uniref:diacylglycerol/lipid kinase family protein n=1 Tax=Cyclobacterium roseum TaxID=2666137 RepID=UPI0013918560|nr:diacylglycerol kinase family protein [Cyclobacterium roseum]